MGDPVASLVKGTLEKATWQGVVTAMSLVLESS
jgi:hypothetical protein